MNAILKNITMFAVRTLHNHTDFSVQNFRITKIKRSSSQFTSNFGMMCGVRSTRGLRLFNLILIANFY